MSSEVEIQYVGDGECEIAALKNIIFELSCVERDDGEVEEEI